MTLLDEDFDTSVNYAAALPGRDAEVCAQRRQMYGSLRGWFRCVREGCKHLGVDPLADGVTDDLRCGGHFLFLSQMLCRTPT